jgi:hypothetical protein
MTLLVLGTGKALLCLVKYVPLSRSIAIFLLGPIAATIDAAVNA